MARSIRDMLAKAPLDMRHGHVFEYKGKPLVRLGWLRHEFLKALKLARIQDFRFHDLRHTFASHFVMNGGDITTLAHLLGHKTIRMTQRYAHLSLDHLKSAIELAALKEAVDTLPLLSQFPSGKKK